MFILLWLKLLSKPTIQLAASAAVVLFFVILCDYYYFFYCVLTALIIFGWRMTCEKAAPLLREKTGLVALATFCFVTAATSGVLVGSLVALELRDPLAGGHSAQEFSLDLLAPFIYGGHWRFASLTKPFWSRLSAGVHESSVHLGLSVLILLAYALRKRKLAEVEGVGLWFFILIFFGVLALGPTLHVWGKAVRGIPMPYSLLGVIFPFLRLSGVPVRMIVMVALGGAVISACSLKLLFQGSGRERMLAAALLVLLPVEYLPKQIPLSEVAVPEYVRVLRNLPRRGGVLDSVSYYTLALFYQTVHEKPMAFGYLARLPSSVVAKDRELARVIDEGRFCSLWPDYHLRYIVSEDLHHILRSSRCANPVWSDGRVWIFDLKEQEGSHSCGRWFPKGSILR